MAISRNAPCPCGSGKKYKKCCLMQDETAAEAQRRIDKETAQSRKAEADEFALYCEALETLTNHTNDCIRAGKWDEAHEGCKRLEKEFPDEIDAEHRFFEYYEARGDLTQAKAYILAALKRIEGNPEKYDSEMNEWLTQKLANIDAALKAQPSRL